MNRSLRNVCNVTRYAALLLYTGEDETNELKQLLQLQCIVLTLCYIIIIIIIIS